MYENQIQLTKDDKEEHIKLLNQFFVVNLEFER